MDAREAQTIIRMVESNWHLDLGAEGRELWRSSLEPFDADVATKAVANLARSPLPSNRSRPQLSDLRAAIFALERSRIRPVALTAGRHPKPEWVKRWQRARDAGDARMFPEQASGYRELQRMDGNPLNVIAYALPEAPTSDASVWVQPGEYVA